MKKQKKGMVAELLVITRIVSDGNEIAVPFGNQKGWDVLAELNGEWKKIQVKTAYKRSGRMSMCVDCIRSGDPKSSERSRGYSINDYDWLIAVDIESSIMWKIPSSVAVGRRCISLTENWKW